MRRLTFYVYTGGLVFFLTAIVLVGFIRGNIGEFTLPIAAICIALVSTSSAYFLAEFAFPDRDPKPVQNSGHELMFWSGLAMSSLAAVLFLTMAETSPLLEIIRRMQDKAYVPTHSGLEIRLVTALMPHWAEAIFEASRRFILPVCGVLMVVGLVRVSALRIALVGSLCLFFILSTTDRAIPVLFAVTFYGARFFSLRRNPLIDRWFYVACAFVLVIVAALKPIQYGEYSGMVNNKEIAGFLGVKQKQEPAKNSIGNIAVYTIRSTVERIAISPVTMLDYAFKEYDGTNFQHWRSTRVFSLLGFGRYIDPLEDPGAKKHHDAFPVTFLGIYGGRAGFYTFRSIARCSAFFCGGWMGGFSGG